MNLNSWTLHPLSMLAAFSAFRPLPLDIQMSCIVHHCAHSINIVKWPSLKIWWAAVVDDAQRDLALGGDRGRTRTHSDTKDVAPMFQCLNQQLPLGPAGKARKHLSESIEADHVSRHWALALKCLGLPRAREGKVAKKQWDLRMGLGILPGPPGPQRHSWNLRAGRGFLKMNFACIALVLSDPSLRHMAQPICALMAGGRHPGHRQEALWGEAAPHLLGVKGRSNTLYVSGEDLQFMFMSCCS